jgi:hypothetical protein
MSAPEGHPLCQTRAEIVRAAKLCAPGIESLGTLTFDGDPVNPNAVTAWREAVFLPLLAPAIREATIAAKHGCRELVLVDASLDMRLAGPLAKTSRTSGRSIAAALQAPNSEPVLKKFLAAVAGGESPGHAAVVFAARASVFHFPACIVAGALVLLEMRAAPIDASWAAVESCIASLPPADTSLRAA